jgi:hypothetical protein
MYILKAALLDILRILFFASLKLVLFTYSRFLSDAVVAGAAADDGGPAARLLPAAGPWTELEPLRRPKP